MNKRDDTKHLANLPGSNTPWRIATWGGLILATNTEHAPIIIDPHTGESRQMGVGPSVAAPSPGAQHEHKDHNG